jgi:hypothetical protein
MSGRPSTPRATVAMPSSPQSIFKMQLLYDLLGRVLFPRQQAWAQRRHAKTLVLTVAFTLGLGLILAKVLRMMYNHQR